VSFEPGLKHLGSPKVADLAVTGSDGTFYLELADLRQSHDAKLADHGGLWFSIGLMDRIGSLMHGRANLQGSFEAAIRVCTQWNSTSGKGMQVAPESSRSELEDWAAPRRLEINAVCGPPMESDECRRIRDKINGEQKQLPGGRANVIEITHRTHFVFESQLEPFVSRIEEAVYEHSHIGLAAIYVRFGVQTSVADVLKFGKVEAHITPGWPMSNCGILIPNRFSEPSFPASTLASLKTCLQHL
jgi:hypothetical protein